MITKPLKTPIENRVFLVFPPRFKHTNIKKVNQLSVRMVTVLEAVTSSVTIIKFESAEYCKKHSNAYLLLILTNLSTIILISFGFFKIKTNILF